MQDLGGLTPSDRDLSAAPRTPIAAVLLGLGLLIAQVTFAPLPGGEVWVRAELTLAAAGAFALGLLSIRGATGRVRAVRRWGTAAMGFWLVGELIRNAELALGIEGLPALSNVPLAGVLVCAALAYWAPLSSRLPRGEQVAVWLDGAIVFFATAALLVAAFGNRPGLTAAGAIDLALAVFFLATFGATLVLDLALRVERRPRGAYVVLAGLILLGAGFVLRIVAPPSTELQDAGVLVHLRSLGVIVVALGVMTWTDVMDHSPGYVRFAARLRRAMPILAVALTSFLMAAHFIRPPSGAAGVLGIGAIGLVLSLVTIRQSVLLSDREAAIGRERRMGSELATTEHKYRSLVERQPGVVYIAEPGPSGRWYFVGPQVATMFGYDAEQWTTDPHLWARLIHPEDRASVVAEDAAVGEAGTVKRLEYRVVRRDGEVVWVLDESTVTETPDGEPLLQGLLLDITSAKYAEEALRASEEQQRMILETASFAFVAIDGDGRVVEWNRHAEETFGWQRDAAIGCELAELIIPPDLRAAHHEGMRRYAETGEGRILSRRIELKALHRDGHSFPVELTIWPVQSGGGVRFNALIDDITVRKELEAQLRHQALHDSLTGLANRALFADRLQHALDRATRAEGASLAVLFLDLDDFKTINDSLGHGSGDELLVSVARRLEETLRPGDTAARLGGDEFGVLLEDATLEGAQALATRIVEAFEPPFSIQNQPVPVHASIGIALNTASASSPEELLRNADLAMYVAKQRGKGRHESYADHMHDAAVRRLELRAGLERALASEQLEVYYQPIVELGDGSVVGCEALIRWRDADGQLVPLSELIPLAEETGLIVAIDNVVLSAACRRAAEWARAGGPPIRLAVNVSAGHLEQGSITREVRGALRASGLDASSLVVEITESTLISDSLLVLRELRQLRKLGVRVAIDDFGMGYSSLSRLRRLPVDIVKIDRSFVSRVAHDREGAVVQSILDMAASMDLEVVAEGIETVAQLAALRARGCVLGQGFYFSQPVPPEAMEAILAVGRLPLARRRPYVVSARGA